MRDLSIDPVLLQRMALSALIQQRMSRVRVMNLLPDHLIYRHKLPKYLRQSNAVSARSPMHRKNRQYAYL